ncbi:MAG: lipase family protein [Cyanobacteria bacterium CRU_2_1]|nr:lipase family protein [Cyanobacteria bacterium RU_5_0]NJR59936.1 lipase family protein [Cyanobacteria bacterium CRU_2_1]
MEPFYFQPKAFGYHAYNAYSLALVSLLAYERDTEKAEQQGRSWGFEQVYFFDEKETQAILLANHEKIIVGFRGSETVLEDWITDFKIRKTSSPCGNVHRGFKAALNPIWTGIEETIEQLRDPLPQRKQQTLWFTGHSLGGALATMATAFCKFNEQPIVVNGLYTYGQPRVGSEKFAANFNAAFKGQTFRFVNNNDVVTRVPPSICDYSHVGQLKYFNQIGEFKSDADLGWWSTFWDRLDGHLESFHRRSPDSIDDHRLIFGKEKGYIPFLKRHRDKWEVEQRQKGLLSPGSP